MCAYQGVRNISFLETFFHIFYAMLAVFTKYCDKKMIVQRHTFVFVFVFFLSGPEKGMSVKLSAEKLVCFRSDASINV